MTKKAARQAPDNQPGANQPKVVRKTDWRVAAAWITRKLWASVAISLVSLAVLISVVRYSLPYMDNQKHYLESWLNEQYGTEISIGYISAMWKGKGPAIILKDVTLAKNNNSPISFTIDETQIELDFWASMRARQIQSQRFNLIGLELEVDLPRIENSGDDFPILDALQTLFLDQLERFSVSNSEVLLRTRLDEQKIQIQQLGWLNKEQRHQGVGQLRVAELARNSATFVMDLTGSKDNFTGTFYAEAEDLDLSPWLKQLIPSDYELQRSRGNFRIWAGLANTRVTFIQANLLESQFLWQRDDAEVQADLVKGDFYAAPTANGWNFNVDDLTLIVNDRVFASHWSGAAYTNGVLTLNTTEAMNLTPLLPLTSVLLGEAFSENIVSMSPQIVVDNAQFFVSDGWQGSFIKFNNFSTKEQSTLPGINALNGDIAWLNDKVHLNIRSNHNYLASENLLGYILPYDRFDLDLFFDAGTDNPKIYIPKLTLVNDTFSIEQSLSYDVNDELLQINANVAGVDITQLKPWFPKLIGPETTGWLNQALVSGNATDATLLWHGKVADFPFSQNNGIFQAQVGLEDIELRFQEDWPSVDDLYATLTFENEALEIVAESGGISGMKINEAIAVIPKMGAGSHIEIKANGTGTGAQARALFNNSSLRNSVGKTLESVKVHGTLNTDLSLYIPFSGDPLQANADVYLNNNIIRVADVNLEINDVNGQLKIENDKLSISGMKGELLAQPISFDLQGRGTDEGYAANLEFNGRWNLPRLVQQFHPQLRDYVSGDTDWTGMFNLTIPESGYHYNFQLASQLQGIDLTLPAPLDKSAEQDLNFFFDSEGDEKVSTVRLLMGRDVKFNGIIPHEEKQFSRAHLSLGGDNFVGMGIGFSVSADLEQIDYSPWYRFVGALLDGLPQSDKPYLEAPQRIFVEAQTLNIAGQKLTNAELLAKNREGHWVLGVASDQARANVTVHKAWTEQGVEIDADFVRFDHWVGDNSGVDHQIDAALLPPIRLLCKQCQLKGYDLGKITLNMSRNATGMNIDLLEIKNRDGLLSANGNWYVGDNADSTRIKGRFDSGDFGAFLKGLDFDSGIRDSDADMEFDLSWGNSPYEFNTASLGGHIDWQLGDGYLTEISDNGARLLSILSLESLLRKLTLDFRDVFAKGFFYEKMLGTFKVQDGLVTTEDTVIDGSAAEVYINGYTDIVENQLNYHVEVKPNITSSLPVLLAWMVNPATAVAAFAFDEMLTSADVVSGIQYSLTGTLGEPKITLLEKTSKVVELPTRNNLPGSGQPKPPSDKQPSLMDSPQQLPSNQPDIDAAQSDDSGGETG